MKDITMLREEKYWDVPNPKISGPERYERAMLQVKYDLSKYENNQRIRIENLHTDSRGVPATLRLVYLVESIIEPKEKEES